MTAGRDPGAIHEDPADQVRFMLGDGQTLVLDITGRTLSDALELRVVESELASELIVGLRLSPSRELLARVLRALGWRKPVPGALGSIGTGDAVAGYEVTGQIGVLPSLDSARFCYPRDDYQSRAWLVREILSPRRYSLGRSTRFVFWVYGVLLRMIPRARFLDRAVFIAFTLK